MTIPGDRTRWTPIVPADPAQNIPVTESSPLTQIKVEPLVAGTEFKTLTKKRSPAISDKSALTAFDRVKNAHTKVGAGNYSQDFFTPAAGKIFMIEAVTGMCNAITPTRLTFAILNGGVEFPFYTSLYTAAWELHLKTILLLINEDDTIRIAWTTVGNGNVLYATVMGHYIDGY